MAALYTKLGVAGCLTHIGTEGSGLEVADTSEPASVSWLGSVGTPGEPSGVAVDGTRAYVADGVSGLQVVDVSNPEAPVIISFVNTPDYSFDVAVRGFYAYVGDGRELLVVDRSLSWPQIVGRVSIGSDAVAVALDGIAHAYVASSMASLSIVNVANATSPHVVGELDLPGSAYGVAVNWPCAYVGTSNWGQGGPALYVVNVANPSAPQVVGSLSFPGPGGLGRGVWVGDGLAFMASDESGLYIVDVSDPTAPREVAAIGLPLLKTTDVVVKEGCAYVADFYGIY